MTFICFYCLSEMVPWLDGLAHDFIDSRRHFEYCYSESWETRYDKQIMLDSNDPVIKYIKVVPFK